MKLIIGELCLGLSAMFFVTGAAFVYNSNHMYSIKEETEMKLNETVKGLLVDEDYNVIDNTLGFCAGYAASKMIKMEEERVTYGLKEPSLITSVGLLMLQVFGSLAAGGYVRKKTREIRQVFAKKEVE